MPETFPENSANDLANTTLTERQLLIHALQHLEAMTDDLADVRGQVLKLNAALSVFQPLIDRYAPGGKLDMIGLMQARREMGRR